MSQTGLLGEKSNMGETLRGEIDGAFRGEIDAAVRGSPQARRSREISAAVRGSPKPAAHLSLPSVGKANLLSAAHPSPPFAGDRRHRPQLTQARRSREIDAAIRGSPKPAVRGRSTPPSTALLSTHVASPPGVHVASRR